MYNAGSKARNDVDKILVSMKFHPLNVRMIVDEPKGPINKILLHFRKYKNWESATKKLRKGDVLVVQYPVRAHTVFLSNALRKIKHKDVTAICIIHDLESLRFAISGDKSSLAKKRYRIEEISALKYFDKIIVHNESMRQKIHQLFGVPLDKMINLEIFDYLYTPKTEEANAAYGGPVLIAGNLDKNKCGYVYDLPEGAEFNLYGANFDEQAEKRTNVKYIGKVNPDELPGVLKGSFGLVWDGPTGNGCKGVFGEYLKYNNPHKTSLYLAAGLPVIVWSESAMADFVKAHKCGLTVGNLNQIPQILDKLSSEEYTRMRDNAIFVGQKLRIGKYTETAVINCLNV